MSYRPARTLRAALLAAGAVVAHAPVQPAHAQAELADVRVSALPGGGDLALDFDRDHALGAGWAVTPTLVLKAEGHVTRGYNVEQLVDFLGAPLRGRYLITSLSASF